MSEGTSTSPSTKKKQEINDKNYYLLSTSYYLLKYCNLFCQEKGRILDKIVEFVFLCCIINLFIYTDMSLNKVILIGNVGKDPDIRYFDSGVAVANFPLATSERGYTLANGTVVPERTEWHNIVARRELVAFVEKWVKKGSGLYVEGKIRSRSYDDQSGVKRYVTEIYADRVEFYSTGSRPVEGQSTTQAVPSQQPQQQQQPSQPTTPVVESSNPKDDLPF